MAIPVLLWGAAAALGATGVVKGVEAIGLQSRAKEIGEQAESKYRRNKRLLNDVRDDTNDKFESLGRLKIEIFNNQINHVVQVLKQQKSTSSSIKNFNSMFTIEELRQMETMVQKSLELESGLLQGAAVGVLAGLGAYGSVPLFAAASTGTAISALSGAAATNATLAWLGGGSLAAGGFGMAGGMMALGGIVAGPALAVGGFFLAGKAEEALTEARAYEARVDEAVMQFDLMADTLLALQENANEISTTLEMLVDRFEQVKVDSINDSNIAKMLTVGKAIKAILDYQIMEKDGSAVQGVRHYCSGYLEI